MGSSITSLSSSAGVSRQQTADGSDDDLGTASKKRAKKTVPEHSVHSGLLEHTHQAAVIHAVAVVGVSQDFPPFSSSLASLLFYSLRLLLCTVEAAALFSDQTIILLMPAVLEYVNIK